MEIRGSGPTKLHGLCMRIGRDSYADAVPVGVPSPLAGDLPPPYTPIDPDLDAAHTRLKNASVPAPAAAPASESAQVEPLEPLPLAFGLLLHSLRLFAAVPGTVGTIYLAARAREAIAEDRWFRGANTSVPCGAEYLVCCLWSMCTVYHATSLMTLLLRRWLIYYALLPAIIRLIAFQSICWSLVRLCLYFFGPTQPIGAWVAISTFTAANDCIARWITSNITDVEHVIRQSESSKSSSDDEHADPRMQRRRRYRDRSMWLIRVLVGGPSDWGDESSDSDDEQPPVRRRARSRTNSSSALQPVSRLRRRARRATEALFFQNTRAARIHSRRVFHWQVAMWRNVVPIALLGYVTLWVLIYGWSKPLRVL